MRIFTLFVTLFFALQSMAQELPGYYITSEGQRTEGYFKTSNFYDTSTLEFRKAEDTAYTRLTTDYVAEYGITDEFKFKKYSV